MTALLPTRVSIYDFLFQDTQPIDAVVADLGHISLPQARIVVEQGIQAITGGIIAYHQNQGAEAVLKKLFNRAQVKELRKYNAFNFKAMKAAIQYGSNTIEALFPTTDTQKNIAQNIAKLASLPTSTVRELLGGLSVLCLRELAILVDFAQLDANEVDQWLLQQSQFLKLSRNQTESAKMDSVSKNNDVCSAHEYHIPNFDLKWLELTKCKLSDAPETNNNVEMPHYAKVIGRSAAPSSESAHTPSSSLASDSDKLIVDNENNNDVLTFCSIENISLPYQRWLLQLAKISDIYLSRNRLKIAPEPVQPPSRPFVNFGFKDNSGLSQKSQTLKSKANPTASESQNIPFWKNPVLILLVLVLGTLTLIAIGKHKYKKAHMTDSPAPQLIESLTPAIDTKKHS